MCSAVAGSFVVAGTSLVDSEGRRRCWSCRARDWDSEAGKEGDDWFIKLFRARRGPLIAVLQLKQNRKVQVEAVKGKLNAGERKGRL